MDNSKNQSDYLDDGFGNQWHKCELGKDCGLEIVRPGKTQCWCDTWIQWIDNFSPVDSNRGFTTAGFYFWDEVGTFCYGPYESHKEAKAKLLEYLKTLE